MDFSKLSYAEINNISSELKTSARTMESLLNEIKTQFNRIGTDDVWSGTAASKTKETFDTLSGKFKDFYQAIMDCSTYLDQMVENYQAVDRAVMGEK